MHKSDSSGGKSRKVSQTRKHLRKLVQKQQFPALTKGAWHRGIYQHLCLLWVTKRCSDAPSFSLNLNPYLSLRQTPPCLVCLTQHKWKPKWNYSGSVLACISSFHFRLIPPARQLLTHYTMKVGIKKLVLHLVWKRISILAIEVTVPNY